LKRRLAKALAWLFWRLHIITKKDYVLFKIDQKAADAGLKVVKVSFEPTLEEMKKYWGLQTRLRICNGCTHVGECWSIPGVAYKPKVMKEHCPYEEVREAVKGMEEMQEGKPLGFYSLRGDWWGNEELLKVIRGAREDGRTV